MDSEGNLLDSTVTKNLKSQTDISTGIGPTGTDTPAPKDIMPHTEGLEHNLEEPLSRPPGALFQAGSGSKIEKSEMIPEPIKEEQPGSNGTVSKSTEKSPLFKSDH